MALFREIKEELDASVKSCVFIGSVENIFTEDNQKHCEIGLIFDVVLKKIKKVSNEDHLEVSFISLDKLSEKKLLPVALRKALLKWFGDKKTFWASQIYDKYIL